MNKITHYRDMYADSDRFAGEYSGTFLNLATPPDTFKKNPELIILVGPPCAGKTTFRKNEIYKDYVILSRDDIREKYWGKDYKYTDTNEAKVSIISENTFNFAVKDNLNIIVDATHCKEQYLQLWLDAKPGHYSIKFYFFYIPIWRAYIRNILRYIKTGKYIPITILKNMYKNYNKINRKKYEDID